MATHTTRFDVGQTVYYKVGMPWYQEGKLRFQHIVVADVIKSIHIDHNGVEYSLKSGCRLEPVLFTTREEAEAFELEEE